MWTPRWTGAQRLIRAAGSFFTVVTSLLLSARLAHAQTAPQPQSMDGIFGSVMGTSLVVALGGVVVAAVAILAVSIPWLLRGGRDVWDPRTRRRAPKDPAWSESRRAMHRKPHATGP
jgi:hypothetical protein